MNEKLEKLGFKLRRDVEEDLVFYEYFKKFANGIKMEICYTFKVSDKYEAILYQTTISLCICGQYTEIAISDEKELFDLIKILNK